MSGIKVPIYGRVNGKNGRVVGHTLVSECDLPKLEGLRVGRMTGGGDTRYACIRTSVNGKTFMTLLHRLLMGAPEELCVDHINHDTFDNRRENLRLATHAQNMANRKTHSCNTSGYKGVSWSSTAKRFIVQVNKQGKRAHLGSFDCPVAAARAYDRFMTEKYGEFASLNFPQGVTS